MKQQLLDNKFSQKYTLKILIFFFDIENEINNVALTSKVLNSI
jgi:hypothetical protein